MEEVKDYPPYLDYPRKPKQMTNGDRIRAMSDKELAVMLANEIPHGDCSGCHLECGVCDGDNFDNGCANGFYKWLKEPYKEDD